MKKRVNARLKADLRRPNGEIVHQKGEVIEIRVDTDQGCLTFPCSHRCDKCGDYQPSFCIGTKLLEEVN